MNGWDEITAALVEAAFDHEAEQEALWGLLGDCLPTDPPAPVEEAA